MIHQKLTPIAKGAIKHLLFTFGLMPQRTGGTIKSRYCYSVWMRHLLNLTSVHPEIPGFVVEIGPGDSLGIGFAALLSGCKKIYALDVVKYWDSERNLQIFDELCEIFQQRLDIPGSDEFPLVKPEIDVLTFPSSILTEAVLKESLAPERLERIRQEIRHIEDPGNKFIKFQIPDYSARTIEHGLVDFIYSQAVLEYISDLETAYRTMYDWLKPSGLMSHSIDFKSDGLTQEWNGHWTFNHFEWRIVNGGKKFYINRKPVSFHLGLQEKLGFTVVKKSLYKMDSKVKKHQLSGSFRNLSEDDLTTSGMYVLSQK